MDSYLKCEDYLNVIKCGILGKMSYKEIENILSFIDLDIVDYVTERRNIIDWYEEFKKVYINYMEGELDLFSKNVDSIIETIDKIAIHNK